MPDLSGRQYSEAEMRAIFERAARAQHAADAPQGSGLSLGELQEVGAASGIAPEHIAAAAASFALEAPAPRARFGVPTEVRRSRVLPGPLGDAQWEEMVTVLRREFKTTGTAGQIGRVREWTGGGAAGSGMKGDGVHVVVRPAPGGVAEMTIEHLGASQNALVPVLLGGAFLGMALFFGVLAATSQQFPIVLPMIMALFGLLMGVGGAVGMRKWARNLDVQFEATLDRLELIALQGARTKPSGADITGPALASLPRPGGEASRPEIALPPEASALDAEADDPAPEASVQPSRARTR